MPVSRLALAALAACHWIACKALRRTELPGAGAADKHVTLLRLNLAATSHAGHFEAMNARVPHDVYDGLSR